MMKLIHIKINISQPNLQIFLLGNNFSCFQNTDKKYGILK